MLPHTLPQWVEKTPFVMNDGSLWLGSRHTHAFFVDSKTGKLIKAMEEFGEEDLKKHEEVPGVNLPLRYRAEWEDKLHELSNLSVRFRIVDYF